MNDQNSWEIINKSSNSKENYNDLTIFLSSNIIRNKKNNFINRIIP